MLAARRRLEGSDFWAGSLDVRSVAARGQTVLPGDDILSPPADLALVDRARVGKDALSNEAIECRSALIAGKDQHILDGEQAARREKTLMHDETFRALWRLHDDFGFETGQCS